VLTNKAIESFKKFIERNTAYAKYKIGSTYYKVPIHRRERLSDGKVAVFFEIEPNASSTVYISEVQIYDTDNELWATKAENIEIESVQDGALYRFAFDFKEV
jgi:hypothetical protein